MIHLATFCMFVRNIGRTLFNFVPQHTPGFHLLSTVEDEKVGENLNSYSSLSPGFVTNSLPVTKLRWWDSAAWLINLMKLTSLPVSRPPRHNKLTNLNWPSFTLGGTFLLFKYKQLDRMAWPAPSTGSD